MIPLMRCGHSANGTYNGKPACVICAPDEDALLVRMPPDLTGRVARCGYCGAERPSSTDLPFFGFRGEGSKFATQTCKYCGYYQSAHEKEHVIRRCIGGFEPRGDSPDDYYCGCRGWD